MRAASSVSVGGVAATQIAPRMKQSHKAFIFLSGALELKFLKRAKGHREWRTRVSYFGGSGSILSRILTVSSMVAPTISRLLGLSLSTVSWVVCQKTSL